MKVIITETQLRLIKEDYNEEIERYKTLLNQSLAKKYRDEDLSYENIKFIDKEIRGINYTQAYITIPQCSIKNDMSKPMGIIRFHIGKTSEVSKQLENSGLRYNLINQIKKRINEKFNIE